MPITYHVMVPFGRDEDGGLVPLEPVECQSADQAKRRASAAATVHAGAIAFSRTGDPGSGEFGDAILAGRGYRTPYLDFVHTFLTTRQPSGE